MDTAAPAAVRSRAHPTSFLMGWGGVLAVLSLLLIAAWNGLAAVAALLGLLISCALVARLWSRLSLAGVTCRYALSGDRIFPGESVELRLGVVNRKALPLPWIQVDAEIPVALWDDTLPRAQRPVSGILSRSTALLWYSRAEWLCPLKGGKRGYYPLGNITVTTGDMFGLFPRSLTSPSPGHIIVYPRLYAMRDLALPSLYPLGETIAERRIFEDPTRAIGVREYTPRDSLRYVHWKASARHRRLQVKVFEPSTTIRVAVFLGVETFWQDGALRDADFELGISAAASLASYSMQHGAAAGLFVNSPQADSREPGKILPGSDATHLVSILGTLAKTTPSPISSTPEFFDRERKGLPLGTALVFVVGVATAPLGDLLRSLKNGGYYRLLVLQVGGSDAVPGIPWQRVDTNGDLMTFGGGGA